MTPAKPGEKGKYAAPRPRIRICFSDGVWWLKNVEENRSLILDPFFRRSGWKVARLCELLGIGKRTFSRMVEEDLGITSKLWLRQVRIVIASHMLRDEEKIEFVAQKVGFRHLSDFDREFKKLVGVSPTSYRSSERSRSTLCGLED